MRILVDINHPAHIHLFKNFAVKLQEKGHDILFTVKDKDVTSKLLQALNLNYVNFGKPYGSHFMKAIGLLKFDYFLLKAAMKFKPDLFISHMSIYAAHVSFLLRKPHIALTDSEHISLKQKHMSPINDAILTPSCFRGNLGPKQIRYDGFHEIAYLHPNYFKPDDSVLLDLNLKPGEKFFIVRKTAGKAVENIGQKLMGEKDLIELIQFLDNNGRVFLSAEGEVVDTLKKYLVKIKPEKMHSLMHYATLFAGDSLTMFTEAALLGTPAFSISSEGFLLGNFDEICDKYELGFRFRNLKQALPVVKELVSEENLKETWLKKRDLLFKEKIDVTQYLVDFVLNFKL